jgi:hypothetical protein
MEDSNNFEIRSQDETWIKNKPRVWTVFLQKKNRSILGVATRTISSIFHHLVDPHSPLYVYLLARLQPLETRKDGILVTIKEDDPINGTIVYLPRHDLTFRITPSMALECQSFPGFVLSTNYRGIGSLIGLQSMISLNTEESLIPRRKIIVPKGKLSSMTGLYGHPVTSINLQDNGGYFAYDVDPLLGRLHGSRSFESDLFLTLLHAFTSSALPDKLTRRAGTKEAIDYLQSASCFSSYTISNEARSYLDTLASLTPQREFYPSHLKVMETINWHPTLPTLSQDPNFLPMTEAIFDHWRGLDRFHGIGSRLSTNPVSTGMNHLAARANARNWIFWSSTRDASALGDITYKHRDSINERESRERELLSFQVASLSCSLPSAFPYIKSLSETIQGWGHVAGPKDWTWEDLSLWISTEISLPDVWSTLYALSTDAGWPPKFGFVATLGLLGYRRVSFGILATLMAVARQTQLVPESLKSSVIRDLDFAQGSAFDREKLRLVLANSIVQYEDSDEGKADHRFNHMKQKLLYESRLRQEMDQVISELESHWPAVITTLNQTETRLLRISRKSKTDLHSILTGWSRNWTFFRHIERVSQILSPIYGPPVRQIPYTPNNSVDLEKQGRAELPTLEILMQRIKPPSSVQSQFPSFSANTLKKTLDSDTTNELRDLLSDMSSSDANNLEALYMRNLHESIDAFESTHQSLGTHTPLLSADLIQSFQTSVQRVCEQSFASIHGALLNAGYPQNLLEATGVLSTITPVTLLKQLSLSNRVDLPNRWKNRLVQYAMTIQKAQTANRMLRLRQDDHMHLLNLEIQHQREWDPLNHPDWLLVEIDADISIRQNQADMAMEMIKPPEDRNSVMQLNMGEGKSSVCIQMKLYRVLPDKP